LKPLHIVATIISPIFADDPSTLEISHVSVEQGTAWGCAFPGLICQGSRNYSTPPFHFSFNEITKLFNFSLRHIRNKSISKII
jgi:hypothetical protein